MNKLYCKAMKLYDNYINELQNTDNMGEKILALSQAAYYLGQAEVYCNDALHPYKYGNNSDADDFAWNMGEFMGLKSNIVRELLKVTKEC